MGDQAITTFVVKYMDWTDKKREKINFTLIKEYMRY